MLTTEDNKFDPFTQEDLWAAEDKRLGHFTPEFIARYLRSSPQLQIKDQIEEYNRAVKKAYTIKPWLYKIVETEVELSHDLIV